MCGVFGIHIGTQKSVSKSDLKNLIVELFLESTSRGKEASGIAIKSAENLSLFREAMSAKKLIKYKPFNTYLDNELEAISSSEGTISGPITVIGHARLMTNGMQGINDNNQPVYAERLTAVHNGIIVNPDEVFNNHPDLHRKADVDSELIPTFLEKHITSGDNIQQAMDKLYSETYGQITTLIVDRETNSLFGATNIGSLYSMTSEDNGLFVCASEGWFLEKAREKSKLLKSHCLESDIHRMEPHEGFYIDENGKNHELRFQQKDYADNINIIPALQHERTQLFDAQLKAEERRQNLKRCSRCVLPETMPGIEFDNEGVCSYCLNHKPYEPKGVDALYEALKPYRRTDGGPEVIMGLSGGRDSSFGVHYMAKEIGVNIVTYTYDWALVTDLARRNVSRMCASLGLEHVLVSADIKQKRKYIRDNINAWLHKPQLGMVPLFMAGDKLYFYYYNEVKKRIGRDIAISCGNRFEKTDFKSGFCGVYNKNGGEGKSWRPYDVSVLKKMKYAQFFAWHMGTNPRYWNASLLDNAKGFYASYIMDHNFLWLFDYIPWEEPLIDKTLKEQYDWETASDTDSTWRVGDGTAAFYNYIYNTVAGFSEYDTFRSNQVREGVITRDEALEKVKTENVPRYQSILEYSHLIGFDFDLALATINQMPKLY